ncbi:MAG: hypothetical protein Q8943_13975 [Bacteroidota bacterium]|nr:hypothetical protein [Bacteroidota bacterium]
MAIHGKIVSRLTEEERQLFKELVGLSNDLRRLVRMAEEQGARTTMLYFTRYGDKIDVLINRFSHDQ